MLMLDMTLNITFMCKKLSLNCPNEDFTTRHTEVFSPVDRV